MASVSLAAICYFFASSKTPSISFTLISGMVISFVVDVRGRHRPKDGPYRPGRRQGE
jgi:hypothetical protein